MPSNLKACVVCTGRFSGSFFTDLSLVCRMCKIRQQLENKIECLTRRLDAFEEFAVNNIGHSVEGSNTGRPSDAAHDGAVGPSAVTTVARDDSPATPPPPNATDSPRSEQDDGFQPGRNGGRVRPRRILPVTVYNRFQAIAEPEEGEN